MSIRIVVADDHTIVRQGLVSLLNEADDLDVVAEAADGIEAVERIAQETPDVAVIDLTMPRLSGIEVVRRLHGSHPSVRLLVLTVHEDEEYVLPIIRAGASGYLVKDTAAEELIKAVRALAAGKAYFGPQAAQALAEQYQRPGDVADPYGTLTPREREVFHLVIEGRTTKEVARAIGTSVKTAENHRARIMEKLSVHNTAELVRYAARKGLLD
jgi:DNA-binding NarL/FixJ family response regulator